jgi:hypothetical protein
MHNIKKLEIKKLFKELDFLESDYEYRNEVINAVDGNFIEEVNLMLERNPELKTIYDEKYEVETISTSEDIIHIEDEEIILNRIESSPKIRKLYREIVKITHPDKVKNTSFNDTYIKATEYYDINYEMGIYKICTELNIDYDVEDNYNNEIKSKINEYKNKIDFLENTFTYQWYINEDVNIKNKLLLKFIENKLK